MANDLFTTENDMVRLRMHSSGEVELLWFEPGRVLASWSRKFKPESEDLARVFATLTWDEIQHLATYRQHKAEREATAKRAARIQELEQELAKLKVEDSESVGRSIERTFSINPEYLGNGKYEGQYNG